MAERFETTWDGLPVSREKPFGVSVVVWRPGAAGREFLVLHRQHHGPSYEGDWAWTPPSGARLPGEQVEAAAGRELLEETGLDLPLERVDVSRDDWAIFVAEAGPAAEIRLDQEHDGFEWVPASEAMERCLPAVVGDTVVAVAEWLDAS